MHPPEKSADATASAVPAPADRAAKARHGAPPPGSPEADEPVFAEPWQAQAFGLVTHLHASGLFTWPEWADALAEELRGQDAALGGTDHYRHWLAALERLLVARGVVSSDELGATTAAWQRAAHATPHGEPILLENDPER